MLNTVAANDFVDNQMLYQSQLSAIDNGLGQHLLSALSNRAFATKDAQELAARLPRQQVYQSLSASPTEFLRDLLSEQVKTTDAAKALNLPVIYFARDLNVDVPVMASDQVQSQTINGKLNDGTPFNARYAGVGLTYRIGVICWSRSAADELATALSFHFMRSRRFAYSAQINDDFYDGEMQALVNTGNLSFIDTPVESIIEDKRRLYAYEASIGIDGNLIEIDTDAVIPVVDVDILNAINSNIDRTTRA